jgi:hypothetical protein
MANSVTEKCDSSLSLNNLLCRSPILPYFWGEWPLCIIDHGGTEEGAHIYISYKFILLLTIVFKGLIVYNRFLIMKTRFGHSIWSTTGSFSNWVYLFSLKERKALSTKCLYLSEQERSGPDEKFLHVVPRGPAAGHEVWGKESGSAQHPQLPTGYEEINHALRHPCEGLMTRQSGPHWSQIEQSLTF